MEFTQVLAYWRDQWKGQTCPECKLGVEAHHLSIIDETSPPKSTCKYDKNGELKPEFKPFFDADYRRVSRSQFDRTPIPGREETLRDAAVAEERAKHEQELADLTASHEEEISKLNTQHQKSLARQKNEHRGESDDAQARFARILSQTDAEAESRVKAAEMRMLEAQALSGAAVQALEIIASLFQVPKKFATEARGDFTRLVEGIMDQKDKMDAKIEDLSKKKLDEIQSETPRTAPQLKVVATPPPIPKAARKG